MKTIKVHSVEALFKDEADKSHLTINKRRLGKEIGRLKGYLKEGKRDYEIIEIMQDLGVIVDTGDLTRSEIMDELEDALCTYRQSCKTVSHF